MIANGEGYKKLQGDNQFRSGLGITTSPINEIIVRGYYDVMGQTNTQTSVAAAIGYQTKKIVAVAEYNLQQNVWNTDGKDWFKTSVGTIDVTSKVREKLKNIKVTVPLNVIRAQKVPNSVQSLEKLADNVAGGVKVEKNKD